MGRWCTAHISTISPSLTSLLSTCPMSRGPCRPSLCPLSSQSATQCSATRAWCGATQAPPHPHCERGARQDPGEGGGLAQPEAGGGGRASCPGVLRRGEPLDLTVNDMIFLIKLCV